MIDVCAVKCGKKLSGHPESRGGTIGICGHIWSCHLPLGQNFTPTLRIHNILSVESARKINPIVSLCWVKKMGFTVWYSFKGWVWFNHFVQSNQQNIHIAFLFSLFIWVQCQSSAIFNQLDPNFAKVSKLSREPITFDTIPFHSFQDWYTELLRI